MSSTIDPKERHWRSGVEALAAEVIGLLDSDPTGAPGDYSGRVAWAASLLNQEAERTGGAAVDPNGPENKYGIIPTKLYKASETAPLIGVKDAKAVYTLGRQPGKLKATRTGPRSGNTRFLGAHIIDYLERMTA